MVVPGGGTALGPEKKECFVRIVPSLVDLLKKSRRNVLMLDTAIESALKSLAKSRQVRKATQIYPYRGTSFVRKTPLLGPYMRII